jgi:hypothetical protein
VRGAVVVSGVPPVESSQPWPLDGDVGEVHGQLNAGLQHRQAVASADHLQEQTVRRVKHSSTTDHPPPTFHGL